jgi:hypothetical protein
VLDYAGKLLLAVSQDHPALHKLRKRFIEYSKRQLVMENYFRHHPPLPATYSAHFRALLDSTAELLANPTPRYAHLVEGLTCVYGSHLEEHWESFQLQAALAASKRKERESIKYIAKLPKCEQQQCPYDLIALEFECEAQPGRPFLLGDTEEVLLGRERRGPEVAVFVLNHLASKDSNTLSHFTGIIDQQIEGSTERRVILKEVKFVQDQYELDPFTYLCQFNY